MWTGLIWLLAINAIVMAGVFRNRSRAVQEITLTERELPFNDFGRGGRDENSGLSLRLDYDNDFSVLSPRSGWITIKHLQDIGFDTTMPPEAPGAFAHYGKMLPRKAVVVLEYDGNRWRDWLADQARELAQHEADGKAENESDEALKERRERYETDRVGHTRLFAVDLGTDADALRSKYADLHHYVLWPASVQLRDQTEYYGNENDSKHRPAKWYLTGSLTLLNDQINVPLALRPALDPYLNLNDRMRNYSRNHPPRYLITLQLGRRMEPWIAAVEPMRKTAP